MKFSFLFGSVASLTGVALLASFFSSCSSGGGGGGGGGVADTGYGPFDSRGNYVEAWADNPSMWKRRPSSSNAPISEPDPSLLASNDAPPSDMSPVSTSPSSGAVEVARLKPTSSSSSSVKPRVTSTSAKPKPKSTTTAAKSKPKPKTVAAKPRSSRVVVKKGDTLVGLASRHGSSVSAIQKANGMRDSKIAIGRSLVIPRL